MTDKDKAAKILIVEDEKRIAEILQDYLRQNNYATTISGNGIEALSLLQKNKYDLILLDIMLPGMDGLELCRKARTFTQTPIIMVTARVEEIDRLLGLEIGADDYICKPFSPREVVARVKVVLRRIAQQAGQITDIGPFQIDQEKQRICINEHKLDLTPTEYRLLCQLIEHPGRVYSRDQLLELCYQNEQQVFDRVIDSHIKNLRKKLSTYLPDKEVLHSVYGVGYRFEI